MALVEDPVRFGLDVIRSKWGEKAYHFVMRFARRRKINPVITEKLDAVGALCGLNAQETAKASNGTAKTTKFPFWLRIVLIVTAFIATSSVIVVVFAGDGNGLYLPGTLYASLSPNDFQKGIRASSNLLSSMAM